MCMPRSITRGGSGRDFQLLQPNGAAWILRVVRSHLGVDAILRATRELRRLACRAAVLVDASLDLATRERGDPALRHPTVGGSVPRVEVREHLVERHDAPHAVAFAPEDDVRPPADADGPVRGAGCSMLTRLPSVSKNET